MEVVDLFGEGSTLGEGILSIPLANLQAVGLSVGNDDKQAIAVAVLLLAHEYFQGQLTDGDGELILDHDDIPIQYDQNMSEPDCNFQFLQKKLSLDNAQLFQDYIITFYSNG